MSLVHMELPRPPLFIFVEQDAGEDAAGEDAEATGREESVCLLVGADVREGYLAVGYAGGQQLPTVTLGQVDVPAPAAVGGRLLPADKFHGEVLGAKGLIHLVAHLEAVEADARPYLRYDVGGTGAIGGSHLANGSLGNAPQRSPPAGMDGTDGATRPVEEQQGDAVGRGDAYAQAAHVGHQRVDTLQPLAALAGRQCHKVLVDDGSLCQVNLVGHQQPLVGYAQQAAQRSAVLAYRLFAVSTIAVDVERSILPTTKTAPACAAEGSHAGADVVIIQFRVHFDFTLRSYRT